MITIKKGDGIILKSGERMIVEIKPFLMWGSEDDWRVAAWTEDNMFRFAVQVIAVVEVWRDGQRVDNIEAIEQLPLI